MGTIAPGTQGMALTDTPLDGAPVLIGGSVDNAAPAVADEGDVRVFRVSTRGELLIGGVTALTGDDIGDPVSLSDDVGNNRALAVSLFGFDGATWDRLRTAASDGDAVAALALGLLQTTTVPLLFNGATFDRLRGDTNGLQAQGTVAHDAVDAGNPAAIGGFATLDVSAEADVAAGDRVRGIFTRKGAQIIAASSPAGDAQNANAVRTLTEGDAENLLGVLGYAFAPDGLTDRIRTLGDVSQDGLGQLCATPAVPGAGVVSAVREIVTNTTTRATAATPTAGNRIRVIHVIIVWGSGSVNNCEVYFGTGANIGTDETKAIVDSQMIAPEIKTLVFGWPDGGGPVGAVDDVLSVRADLAIPSDMKFVIQFRQE